MPEGVIYCPACCATGVLSLRTMALCPECHGAGELTTPAQIERVLRYELRHERRRLLRLLALRVIDLHLRERGLLL